MNQETMLKQTNEIREKCAPTSKLSLVNNQKNDNDDVITAVGNPKFFCVGIIDIVNSTKTVAQLQPDLIPQYYEIFLNNMAKVVNRHHADILKIMGDSLLFYFPDTCYSADKAGFLNVIECSFSMVNAHARLNQILKRYMLPAIDFRISFDYGNVTMMKTSNGLIDLVGPSINTCAKINDLAPINGAVFGGDLYEVIKHFRKYRFKRIGDFSIGLKQSYPIFTFN